MSELTVAIGDTFIRDGALCRLLGVTPVDGGFLVAYQANVDP